MGFPGTQKVNPGSIIEKAFLLTLYLYSLLEHLDFLITFFLVSECLNCFEIILSLQRG